MNHIYGLMPASSTATKSKKTAAKLRLVSPEILPENQILQGDCISVMQNLPEKSVDMVFADPPYNLQLAGELRRPNQSVVKGVDDNWDKFTDFKEYDRFTEAWLSAARRALHDDGSLWVIGSYHNIFRVGTILQDLGFWMLNDVIWRKTNPMPNFRGKRFTNAHETLIWCAKSKESRAFFNYRAMKALNEDRQMRSDWLLPICGGGERLRDENGDKQHPTHQPEALLYRILMASTQPGHIVLDPFFGSGTTGAVAKRLGRRWIGIERETHYIEVAQSRIEAVKAPEGSEILRTEGEVEAARIPFGLVLERGLLKPGDPLCDFRKRVYARVRPDGSLAATTPHGDCKGSIHKVGAAVQGLPACNGWSFWHYRDGQNLLPIDMLRRRLRTEMGLPQGDA